MKPWTCSWSMAGVWMVDCGLEGSAYGRHQTHLVFAEEDKATALKVAAADEMLATLKWLREFVDFEVENRNGAGALMTDYEGEAQDALDRIDAAIAKATGL